MEKAWRGFADGTWKQTVDVRDFIIRNRTPYEGDASFLAPLTERTEKLWSKCEELLAREHAQGGVLDIDTETISGITAHQAGYMDPDNEVIVGLQTNRPLCRAINPFGGIRMAVSAAQAYGYTIPDEITQSFTTLRRTHNDGVFTAYTEDMRRVRKSGVISGLPDAYGRGRIIGDYRRVALYGLAFLVETKQRDLAVLLDRDMDDETIRLREETHDQIAALEALRQLGEMYGFDLSKPAATAFEAIEWTYLAFLGAVRETNGAANSIGRVSTFFDIYLQRDLSSGLIDEPAAQELVDQFILKLRLIRHLRTPEYNELFAGDPLWITEALGGMGQDGIHLVTKTSFRFLHVLTHLGPSPEPNLTILWSAGLPEGFKRYCAHISITTSALQYENDDLMRLEYGDDYGISCCVSAMRLGKDMQFFGARCNLPKLLLMALNGGRDELTGTQIAPPSTPYTGEYLDFDEVHQRFLQLQQWLSKLYVNTLNTIHYMHDKYAYERLMMALHDTEPHRCMAFGIAGLSVVADAFSAMRHTKVRPVRDERGLIVEFELQGGYPRFGNDDDRVDGIAARLVEDFIGALRQHKTYRNAEHTLSILTITSNVVYGKKTGATPDGRKKGEPFAPGANPMHGRDSAGALATLNSLAKLPFHACRDGISLTLSLLPRALGHEPTCRTGNFCAMLDGYFLQGGHHVNINVLDRSLLEEAMAHPEKYPQLTIRVSGYAVNFHRLTTTQQREVISRTFHEAV